MNDPVFDHEKLDAYRLTIEYIAESFEVARSLSGVHRHTRDQWIRAAQSIALNIAEGNGRRSPKDRSRFFDIARGSALECSAIQDVLVVTDGIETSRGEVMKVKLSRMVAMLTRLSAKADRVCEEFVASDASIDYEHEHRPSG